MTRIHPLGAAFAAAAVTWAVALPAAAAASGAAPPGSPARVASQLVYAAGAVVCHQRPERSFHLVGQALPVCARCAGIYAGAAGAVLVLGAAALVGAPRTGRRRPALDTRLARRAAVAAFLPTALTLAWEWEWGMGRTPANVLRAAAGVPVGLFVAWVVMLATRRPGQSE
ncbi:MAG TPA: DUF2085 domain-containing protein [Vicinamibacterales bacterium]|nr:DUF2085 domain-containing protein [Vicinamibacterales bacterium]